MQYFLLLLPWGCAILLACGVGRIWWTAVRTGRWLKGGGRAYYFPNKQCTFTIYDRTNNPILYWLGVIGMPTIVFGFFFLSVLLTVGASTSLLQSLP